MKFIDLFAGLGGFHIALSRLGHECVFACEINEDLQKVYEKNFCLKPQGNIKNVSAEDIPKHDILCAGFPCQPFSKAGHQRGFNCPKWGDLFDDVMRIVRHHLPSYVILENVPNLAHHNKGDTWEQMKRRLKRAGYEVEYRKLSPHKYGIPQIRERVFIVASLGNLGGFSWPTEHKNDCPGVRSVLDKNPPDAKVITPQIEECLQVWQEFIEAFPVDQELPSFPIWSMEFGATYPFENNTPYKIGQYRLRKYRGSHGAKLAHVFPSDRMDALPSHARNHQKTFPEWKIQFIRQNRELYLKHKQWIDKWMPKILKFPSSYQKLEWNCKGERRNIWQYIVQMRASGVRVKRPTSAPALVAMTDSQVPIIAWERRYMTPRECARLQSLYELKFLPDSKGSAYEALGNAVNADLVELISKNLLPVVSRKSPSEEKHTDSLALANV